MLKFSPKIRLGMLINFVYKNNMYFNYKKYYKF